MFPHCLEEHCAFDVINTFIMCPLCVTCIPFYMDIGFVDFFLNILNSHVCQDPQLHLIPLWFPWLAFGSFYFSTIHNA